MAKDANNHTVHLRTMCFSLRLFLFHLYLMLFHMKSSNNILLFVNSINYWIFFFHGSDVTTCMLCHSLLFIFFIDKLFAYASWLSE